MLLVATVVLAGQHFELGQHLPLDGMHALDERLERHGFATVPTRRLLVFLAPPLNWALGATRVRARHYVAGTALGAVPGIATAVLFADSIAARAPDEPLLGRPSTTTPPA
jgi:uncharacterized membrane protein YdjX (TVP38/TMEM64 family)